MYRGVFGSHVANVLRRLRRICALLRLATRVHLLLGHHRATRASWPRRLPGARWRCRRQRRAARPRSVRRLQPAGRQQGARHRAQSASVEPRAHRRATRLQTASRRSSSRRRACASRSCSRYLRERMPRTSRDRRSGSRGYRGGYLPNERRADRARLRDGRAARRRRTNALELGIDIGGLDAACWSATRARSRAPGSSSAARAAGNEPSLAVLVASSSPLDQFVAAHPDYLFDGLARGRACRPGQPARPHQPPEVRRASSCPSERGRAFGAGRRRSCSAFLEEERGSCTRRAAATTG